MVEVIAVLDIRGGVAVAGKSGRRDEYKPLKTVFSDSSNPVEITSNLPCPRLYVADLDGISRGQPDTGTLKSLSKLKEVMVDLGVRGAHDLQLFSELDCGIVLGTETISDMDVITEAIQRFGGGRIIVSIDIKNGDVLSSFLPSQPLKTYRLLVAEGVERVIFLDISSVGTGKSDYGFIKDLNKAGEILLGGGITAEDFEWLECAPVDGVLVGTALHRGELDVRQSGS